MSIYKQNKLIKIAQEFDKDGDTYNINGIDLEEAIFFYREPTLMYEVIPKGSYNIVVEDSNTNLVIIDQTILTNMEKIQIGYLFATMSSPYEVDFNVDATILKNEYNKLVTDMKNLYTYVNTNMMVADGQDVTLILPKIDSGEVWVKGEEGYYGLNVGDITKNIGEFWIDFEVTTEATIEYIEKTKTDAKNEIDEKVLQGKTDITASQIEYFKYMDDILRRLQLVDNAFRYFSGNNVMDRDNQVLLYELNGGNIADRTVDTNAARVISGGNVEDRQVPILEVIE